MGLKIEEVFGITEADIVQASIDDILQSRS